MSAGVDRRWYRAPLVGPLPRVGAGVLVLMAALGGYDRMYSMWLIMTEAGACLGTWTWTILKRTPRLLALTGIVMATVAGGRDAATAGGTMGQLLVRRRISIGAGRKRMALVAVQLVTRGLIMTGVKVAAYATVTSAAAARGTRRRSGGARLRRWTYLARRPQGAAVTRAGVGRKWPNVPLCEPAPWASGVLALPTFTLGVKLAERDV